MKARTQEGNENQTPEDYNLMLRERQVVELRLRGLEFEEIARRTGYANHSGAWKAWKRAIARIPIAETQPLRLSEDMRLNVALDAIWSKVQSGDLWAIDRMIELTKERRALWGLDKQPQKAEVLPPVPLEIKMNFDPDML